MFCTRNERIVVFSFTATGNHDYAMKKQIKHDKLAKFLHRHVPITSWLPKYDREKATGDVISGITIGLTMIPQSLAYASLANLSPQVPLYFSFEYTEYRYNRYRYRYTRIMYYTKSNCSTRVHPVSRPLVFVGNETITQFVFKDIR